MNKCFSNQDSHKKTKVNPFSTNVPLLYPLKLSVAARMNTSNEYEIRMLCGTGKIFFSLPKDTSSFPKLLF